MQETLERSSETAKTYTLASWLPSVRVSRAARPHTTVREDAITIVLGAFSLVALFWDGLRHNNLTGVDNFWSPPHIALYAGLTGLGVWIAYVLMRRQSDATMLEFSQVPRGYTLAIVALPLAAIAGPADMIWHAAYGFENQIDSTYSPPHQGLFIAGALLAAIPLSAAWQRRSEIAPSLGELLPAAVSTASIAGVMLFVIHQTIPFYGGAPAMTSDFQADIAGRADAFAPGEEAVHVEGLARALTNFSDDAFPYYFYSTHHAIAGIFLTTAVLVGAVLMLRRRWQIPAGTVTVMFTFLAVLWPMLSEYRQADLLPALILAGVVGDLLLARLVGRGRRPDVWRVRLFAGLLPVALWSLLFLCIAVLGGGLGWGPTLWVGVLVTSAALGYMVSLVVFQPSWGAADEPARDDALVEPVPRESAAV